MTTPRHLRLDNSSTAQTSNSAEVSPEKRPDHLGAAADLDQGPLEEVRIPYERTQLPPVTHDRPRRPGVQAGEYGATVPDGGIREQTQVGQAAERWMGFEPELVLGRPCDWPGCA